MKKYTESLTVLILFFLSNLLLLLAERAKHINKTGCEEQGVPVL